MAEHVVRNVVDQPPVLHDWPHKTSRPLMPVGLNLAWWWTWYVPIDKLTHTVTYAPEDHHHFGKCIYIAFFLQYLTLEALGHDYSITCNYANACLYLVSVHLPRLRLRTSNCSLFLNYPPRQGESAWLADLQWTVYPYKWSAISCRSSTGQGKFVLPLCHTTNQLKTPPTNTTDIQLVSDIWISTLNDRHKSLFHSNDHRHINNLKPDNRPDNDNNGQLPRIKQFQPMSDYFLRRRSRPR